MKEIEEDTNERKYVCAHGLEELIFLICPYYPKQSTDSMLSLSKSNNIFHRNRKKSQTQRNRVVWWLPGAGS